ncbi:MAG: sigma-54-dependent transcriptional regulator [Bacteroidota bacterium]
MKASLFIIDDDPTFVNDIRLFLEEDFSINHALEARHGLKLVKKQTPDIVLLDLMLDNHISGLDILKELAAFDPYLPIIMITDYASIDTAVQGIRDGAFDYITKSPHIDELKLVIEKALKQRSLKVHADFMKEELHKPYKDIVGTSPAMQEVREKISLFAGNPSTVLITGESGVGKELVARHIHRSSERSDEPFMAINCAAIPKELMESELFGHEKGSFTGAEKRKIGKFEAAGHGTIFLDEISELPADMQAKLLRVLQEREFHRVGGNEAITAPAKVIAATNRKLHALVADGQFREDLYYRLDVLPITLPPLRERPQDIEPLAKHLLRSICTEMKIPVKSIDDSALDLLQQYEWPGNVRELRNVLTRGIILCDCDHISASDLDIRLTSQTSNNTSDQVPTTWNEMDEMRSLAAEEARRQVERVFIDFLLEKFDHNVSKAAEFAGINRTSLHKMIRRSLDES